MKPENNGIKKTKYPRTAVIMILLISTVIFVLFVISSSAYRPSVPEIKNAKGSDFTSNSYISARLDRLFALLPYSSYPYFTVYGNKSCGNSSCGSCNVTNVCVMHPNIKDENVKVTIGGYSCFGFGQYAAQYIFGTEVSGLNYLGNNQSGGTIERFGRVSENNPDRSLLDGGYENYTLSSLKTLLQSATTGDILQLRSRSGSKISNHTMIFLGYDSDGIFVIHNNSYRDRTGDDGKAFGYNRVLISFMSYEAIKETWNSVVTVYRYKSSIYNAVWSKGTAICETHSYSAENGDVCTVCGYKFDRPVDASGTGLYTLKSGEKIYSDPYTSANTSAPSSGILTVTAGETNSVGEKWYRTADGKYVKASACSKYKENGSIRLSMFSYPLGGKKLYSSFVIRGTVEAEESDLAFVSGYLISSAGTAVQSVTVKPIGPTLNIESSDVNYKLQFGNLSLGSYSMLITAGDEKGNYASFLCSFRITEKDEPVVRSTPAPPSAPPRVAVLADTYIILDTSPEYEYSIDGINWQQSGLFSELTPRTDYKLFCRYAETMLTLESASSPALSVKTDYDRTPPSAPEVDLDDNGELRIYDTMVYLKDEGDDYEYSLDGESWQRLPFFKGLYPATKYMFFKREVNAKVPSAGLLVKTLKSTVSAPASLTVIGFTDTTIDIVYSHEFVYGIRPARSSEGIVWQDPESFTGTFSGLSPATKYYLYCMIAETEQTYQSKPSIETVGTTDKSQRRDVPPAPQIVSKNSSSVTLLNMAGVEYSIDGEYFTKKTTFDDLTAGQSYTFVCRYAESDRYYPGESSDELVVDIVPGVLSSSLYSVNDSTRMISGIAPKTSVTRFLRNINESRYASVYRDGKQRTGNLAIATGDTIVIYDADTAVAEYTMIVEGDLNRDGTVTLTDYMLMKKYLYEHGEGKAAPLSDIIFAASDLNGDGYVNAVDYSILKQKIK